MEKLILDSRGDLCPVPVVKALKALEHPGNAEVLEVHAGNETAVNNILRMATGKGLHAVFEKIENDHYIITIPLEKVPSGNPGNPGNQNADFVTGHEPELVPEPLPMPAPYIVAIDSDSMGRGNEELGRILMKGFLYAVSHQETLPAAILFYNGGARIPVEGSDSDSLEDLHFMESQGVEILTCGTCLNFYDLTEKLAVGSVTNMYSIAQKLTTAARVIRP